MRYSGIGGQAVLEGVMMRNKGKYAVAVRKPDHNIEVKVDTFKSVSEKHPFLKWPLLRGVVNFVESLYIGMKALTFSSGFYEEEEKKEKNEKKDGILSALTVVFSIVLAISVFMVLPYGLSLIFRNLVTSDHLLTVIEGVIRLLILIAYMVGISFLHDIKRVYMYHGAEHKAINCIESGFPLTVSNVKRMTKKHLRCGTSFIIDVVILSVILFMFIRVENAFLRLGFRLLLVPVIAAIAYEFIRIAGKSENPVVKFLSIPGLWFQSLTTKEPDEKMIEVAISSVEAVFDWKAFLEKSGQSQKKGKTEKTGKKIKTGKTSGKGTPNKTIKMSELKEVLEEMKPVLEAEQKKEKAKKAAGSSKERQKARLKSDAESVKQSSKSIESFAVNQVNEEDDDEILNALDRFFNSKKEEPDSHKKGKKDGK